MRIGQLHDRREVGPGAGHPGVAGGDRAPEEDRRRSRHGHRELAGGRQLQQRQNRACNPRSRRIGQDLEVRAGGAPGWTNRTGSSGCAMAGQARRRPDQQVSGESEWEDELPEHQGLRLQRSAFRVRRVRHVPAVEDEQRAEEQECFGRART